MDTSECAWRAPKPTAIRARVEAQMRRMRCPAVTRRSGPVAWRADSTRVSRATATSASLHDASERSSSSSATSKGSRSSSRVCCTAVMAAQRSRSALPTSAVIAPASCNVAALNRRVSGRKEVPIRRAHQTHRSSGLC